MKILLHRIFPWILIIFFLVAGSSMVRTLWHAHSGYSAVSQEEQKVLELEEEVTQLEMQAREATSSFALEKRVRQELQLQKSGEAVIKVE